MATYTLTLNGLDARVTLDHGVNTVSAYGLTFDESADVVTETESRRFSGYCDSEIVYSIACDMLHTRRGIEAEDISDAVEALGLTCECE
jgi:hypothetical protein